MIRRSLITHYNLYELSWGIYGGTDSPSLDTSLKRLGLAKVYDGLLTHDVRAVVAISDHAVEQHPWRSWLRDAVLWLVLAVCVAWGLPSWWSWWSTISACILLCRAYAAVTYRGPRRPILSQQVVVVIRGTDERLKRNVRYDERLWANKKKPSHSFRVEPAEDLVARLGQLLPRLHQLLQQRAGGQTPQLRLSLTGHSLGGLVAEAAMVMIYDSNNRAFADVVARCVSFESPGLPPNFVARAMASADHWVWEQLITGYVHDPNPINMLYQHLGTIVHVLRPGHVDPPKHAWAGGDSEEHQETVWNFVRLGVANLLPIAFVPVAPVLAVSFFGFTAGLTGTALVDKWNQLKANVRYVHGICYIAPCWNHYTGQLHWRCSRPMRSWPHFEGQEVIKAVFLKEFSQAQLYNLPGYARMPRWFA